MTSISLERGAAPLRLHSCTACGRHAWRSRGCDVDRSALLEALRVPARPAARPAPRRSSPRRADDSSRRTELQHLLTGFTVHGTSS